MFQILSLSGGGFLGLYSLTVLAELERETGTPIGRCFDLVAGTSVGGIVALAIAAEVPMAALKRTFEEQGQNIFSNRKAPSGFLQGVRDLLRSMFGAKYSSARLEQVLVEIFQDRTLGDVLHRVIVPTVNLTKGSPQIFKTPHHSNYRRDFRLRIVDVALATSAAPTYFPAAQIGDELFADGGLYANSPDLLALHETEHFLGKSITDVKLLSIGTTTSSFSFSHRIGRDLGSLGWLIDQRLMRASIGSQQMATAFIAKHRLGDNYVRIDVTQSATQQATLALDVAHPEAQYTLRALGESSVRELINNPTLRTILEHHAPAPTWPALPKDR